MAHKKRASKAKRTPKRPKNYYFVVTYLLQKYRFQHTITPSPLSLFLVLAAGLMVIQYATVLLPQAQAGAYVSVDAGLQPVAATKLEKEIADVQTQRQQLSTEQQAHGLMLSDETLVSGDADSAAAALKRGDIAGTRFYTTKARSGLETWRQNLDRKVTEQARLAAPVPSSSMNVPIVMYHHTPADFETQIQGLLSRGFTPITPDQLGDSLRGGAGLPSKPVLITFDDGYSDQLQAFDVLKKYQVKATFYIITGGATSKWCIGADRRYDQGYACGDGYLNWGEIGMLDGSGLITIGSHTVNHLDLAALSPDIQQFEIQNSKYTIESHLHHLVNSFAYPDGKYNDTAISLVRSVGYTTAVSTDPGVDQTLDRLYTLYRIRDVSSLY